MNLTWGEIATFREYFPEYRDLPLIGILATLAVEDSVLSYAEKQGFLVLAVGDQVMEVKNRPGFEPKRWWRGKPSRPLRGLGPARPLP
jgi:hypothetical protein